MENKPLRDKPAEFKQWGTCMEEAQQQMKNACELPISESGALMADSHIGYGLPIGGVLATRNSVIPYAVGVDIACRGSGRERRRLAPAISKNNSSKSILVALRNSVCPLVY